jgi:hypothetical protein
MIMGPAISQKRLLGSLGSFKSLLGKNDKKREKNAICNFTDGPTTVRARKHEIVARLQSNFPRYLKVCDGFSDDVLSPGSIFHAW